MLAKEAHIFSQERKHGTPVRPFQVAYAQPPRGPTVSCTEDTTTQVTSLYDPLSLFNFLFKEIVVWRAKERGKAERK